MRAIEFINGCAPYIWELQLVLRPSLRAWDKRLHCIRFWLARENRPQSIELRVLGQKVRHRGRVLQVWFCLLIFLGSNIGSLHLALGYSTQDITILRQVIQPLFVNDDTSIARVMAAEVVKPYGNRLAAYTELAGKLPAKECVGRRIGRTQ
jgi:hypothetical protein